MKETKQVLIKNLTTFSDQQEAPTLPSTKILAMVSASTDIIAPAWSLNSFVASNPLQGFENLSFEEGIEKAKEYFKVTALPDENLMAEAVKAGRIEEGILEELAHYHIASYDDVFSLGTRPISMKDLINQTISSRTEFPKEIYKDPNFKLFIEDYADRLSSELEVYREPEHCLLYRSEKLIELVNTKLIKFLELFFDEGQALFPMPGKEKGFYGAWRDLAIYEKYGITKAYEVQKWIENLPDDPAEAVSLCLAEFEIQEQDVEDFLRVSLTSLPGWSSFIKWKIQYAQNPEDIDISFVEYLAVRLCVKRIALLEDSEINTYLSKSDPKAQDYDFMAWVFTNLYRYGLTKYELVKLDFFILRQICSNFHELKAKKGIIILESLERSYRNQLNKRLKNSLKNASQEQTARPEAQLVFCIDVRSEPFRKKIEKTGDYETFGFAGFFGIPIKFKSYEDGEACDSCPVLLKPKHIIEEKLDYSKLFNNRSRKASNDFIASFNKAMKEIRMNTASAFSFAEATGLIYATRMLTKTFFPYHYKNMQKVLEASFNPKPNYSIDLEQSISFSDQLDYAQSALSMIGLKANFAPIVVFCAHGSTTENNPYASALDCGACGGQHGGPNARILAQILNNSDVRTGLIRSGICIPRDTIFVGAEHNTTNDNVQLFDHELDMNCSKKESLLSDLRKAKEANNHYRMETFSTPSNPDSRSSDWSETRPEWGLAGNASFIIAPRSMTKDLDLKSRSFLHSYNHWQDDDSKILETIMTAPMIVTQWINSQYLFSSINNTHFGSGSKITHNVYGTCAVVQGNSSDLMHGLPLQSVKAADDKSYHQCQRIINYIHAPRAKVKTIIDKHEILQKLVYNSWVKMVIIDPEDQLFYEMNDQKEFVPLDGEAIKSRIS